MRIPIGFPLTAVVAVAAALGLAQVAAEFEVASVKPNKLNDRIVTIDVGPGGRFAARGYTLVLLIQRAYAVMDWNVTGGPGWIRTERFDVTAKADVPGNLTEAQLRPMLQRLLAGRFKLEVHKSSREMPGYALTVDKSGPKFKASADGQEHPDTFRMRATGLSGQGITMYDLARFVAGKLGLVAVDETGLTGFFDVSAEWKIEPEDATAAFPGSDPRDAMRYAVFAALRDQLGLKFVPKKINVPMIVIDHAEKASASEN